MVSGGGETLVDVTTSGEVERGDRRGDVVGFVVGVGRGRPFRPATDVRRREGSERLAGEAEGALQQEVSGVDAAEFFGAGVQVNQLLGGARRSEELVAAGGHFAEADAEGEDEIRRTDAGGELRVDADADVAGVERVAIVEGVLKAKGAADGEAPALGEVLEGTGAGGGPAGAAGDDQGTFGRGEQLAEAREGGRSGPRLGGNGAREDGRGGGGGEQVLGEDKYDGSGAALHRGMEGAGDVLRQAMRLLDFRDPLGHAERAGAEDVAVIEFLKGFAVTLSAGPWPTRRSRGVES